MMRIAKPIAGICCIFEPRRYQQGAALPETAAIIIQLVQAAS
jgi:hypothetical protein